jgi:hypothetical protein
MNLKNIGLPRYLQVAGILIIVGLLIEVVSLVWFHPLAFVLFAFVGASLMGLGMVVYLASIVFVAPEAEKAAGTR